MPESAESSLQYETAAQRAVARSTKATRYLQWSYAGSPSWDQQATTACIAEYCLNKAISFSLQPKPSGSCNGTFLQWVLRTALTYIYSIDSFKEMGNKILNTLRVELLKPVTIKVNYDELILISLLATGCVRLSHKVFPTIFISNEITRLRKSGGKRPNWNIQR